MEPTDCAPPAPKITIVEHPAFKEHRFRYQNELQNDKEKTKRSTPGSIPGENSTLNKKTYPTIRIDNFIGDVTIIVSCVTWESPYRPHPHSLVGPTCNEGICCIRTKVTATNNTYEYQNIGIQCVRRQDIKEALATRSKLKIDPLGTGFKHTYNGQSLKAVRLAFQVLLHDANGRPKKLLKPAVSNIIQDKKAADLDTIYPVGACSGSVSGGTPMGLLCDSVKSDDIEVVFYQEDSCGRRVWQDFGIIDRVHRQVTVVFMTPPYSAPFYNPDTHQKEIKVYIQLRRKSDGKCSKSVQFKYFPDPDAEGAKKRLEKPIMPPLLEYETESEMKQESLSILLKPAPSTSENQGPTDLTDYQTYRGQEPDIERLENMAPSIQRTGFEPTMGTHYERFTEAANAYCAMEALPPHHLQTPHGSCQDPSTSQGCAHPYTIQQQQSFQRDDGMDISSDEIVTLMDPKVLDRLISEDGCESLREMVSGLSTNTDVQPATSSSEEQVQHDHTALGQRPAEPTPRSQHDRLTVSGAQIRHQNMQGLEGSPEAREPILYVHNDIDADPALEAPLRTHYSPQGRVGRASFTLESSTGAHSSHLGVAGGAPPALLASYRDGMDTPTFRASPYRYPSNIGKGGYVYTAQGSIMRIQPVPRGDGVSTVYKFPSSDQAMHVGGSGAEHAAQGSRQYEGSEGAEPLWSTAEVLHANRLLLHGPSTPCGFTHHPHPLEQPMSYQISNEIDMVSDELQQLLFSPTEDAEPVIYDLTSPDSEEGLHDSGSI